MRNLPTHQLHGAVIYLVDMAQTYNPLSFRMEFRAKRKMQVLKQVTKFRTVCSLELVEATKCAASFGAPS